MPATAKWCAALLALPAAACGPLPASNTAIENASSVSEIGRAAAPSFRPLARDTWAMTYDAAALPRGDAEVAVREHCAGKQWCKVLGWSDTRLAATALPMTDRELAGQRFSYTLNRATGMDEFSWN